MEVGFVVGDKAVYPVHGVAEVIALEQRDMGGSEIAVYILQIIESGLTIMVPTTNASTVGLRSVISASQASEVLEILSETEVARDTQTWNRRYREYMEKIRTGSVFEIAEVLRDLCLLRNVKDLSFGERKMLDTARGLLVSEIAVAKKESEHDVRAQIESIFTHAA